jgi:hypothetical protein
MSPVSQVVVIALTETVTQRQHVQVMVAPVSLVPRNVGSWRIYGCSSVVLAKKYLAIQKFCETTRHTKVAFDHDGCTRNRRKRIEGLHRTNQIVQVDSTSPNKHLLQPTIGRRDLPGEVAAEGNDLV